MIPGELDKLHVHLVGIGGCGMSGLAALLLRHGARVSGSDMQDSETLDRLRARGARVTADQSVAVIPETCDLVVASAAIRAGHPELADAERRGLRVLKYAELLGAVMSHYEGVAISGTHGKSTTSAWLAFVLREAGLDPTFVIGADVQQLGGGSGVGDGRHFVAEACEYDRSFLSLRPRHAVILNIEEDHLDYYKDIDDIRQAFGAFLGGLSHDDGLAIINGDDAHCTAVAAQAGVRVQTFGTGADVNWRATDAVLVDGVYEFDVARDGQSMGRVRLGLSGRHNVHNALAVIAGAHDCGVAWKDIVRGLAEFRGVRRRLEQHAAPGDVLVVDDYAHHPTEIQATLQAARDRFNPRRLWCVFQPHQHSRTRFLLDEFARSFAQADRVIVPDIYFVRDSQRDREAVSAEDLVRLIRERGGAADYLSDFGAIVELLVREARGGDVILTMGAGNIWKVADALAGRLGENLRD